MKLKHLIYSKKFTQLLGVGFLISLLAYGVYAKIPTKNVKIPIVKTVTTSGWKTGGPINVKATLSQNKVLQGSDGLVYMQIDLEALDDDKAIHKKRVPTDFVIVLDRSGSMSGRNKMTFAHKAIESLLQQVGKDDRFALVTFDNHVETPVDLKVVNDKNREDIIGLVKQVTPRGSTNLSAGLIRGMDILKNSSKKSDHAQRLILLSDGMANAGITNVAQLGKIAAGAVKGEFVISSIGLGLDFNETLLSSIADYGTGSYYFMENVAKLDKILSREFYGASQILAKNLKLKLELASGIKVVEASGYPITRKGNAVFIQPGHLYQKQKKSFFVTLKMPTKDIYAEALGDAKISYVIGEKAYEVALIQPDLTVACLPQEKIEDVKKSINTETFTNAWTQNNFGQILKKGSGFVRNGDLGSAKGVLNKFKKKLQQAYSLAPSPEMKAQIDKLDDMDKEVEEAFTGADKDEKQKRLSKQYHYDGGQSQRVEDKKK